MVIVRKADFHNKYKAQIFELKRARKFVLLFVVGATHRMTMIYIVYISVLQVLFGACKEESNLTSEQTREYNESA
jgi:hypothetical protein